MKKAVRILLILLVAIIVIYWGYHKVTESKYMGIIQKDYINNSQTLASSVNSLQRDLIPYTNYTCKDIFPEEVNIDLARYGVDSGYYSKTNYKNNVKMIANCKPQTRTGGNINLYECTSGFYIIQEVLPDGTIIDKHYHVMYSFSFDKRDCISDSCPIKFISCNYDNLDMPKLSDSDYLKYFNQPKIYLNGTCYGCVASDGGCVSIGTYWEGSLCHA